MIKISVCKILGMSFLLVAMGCHSGSSTSQSLLPTSVQPSSTTAEVVKAPDTLLDQKEDLNSVSKSDSQYNQDVLNALDGTKAIPFFFLTYAEPGNSDVSVIRQKIRQADAYADLNKDLNRERQFIDYPYMVDTYFISINTKEAYKEIIDTASRYPHVRVIAFPIRTLRVRSFLKIQYARPLLAPRPDKLIYIGESYPMRVGSNFSQYNLEDVTTYLTYFEVCRDVTPGCLATLISEGYLKQDAVIDGNHVRPIEFLSTELGESAYLRSRGLNGRNNITGKGVLNLNFDRRVITNLTLSHELWVTGKSETGDPSTLLLKVFGSDGHPVVEQASDGSYSYMIPVQAFTSEIPKEVRENLPHMGVYTSQFQNVMVQELSILNNTTLNNSAME